MDEFVGNEENVLANNSSISTPAQDENGAWGEQVHHLLIESIATVTRLTALVTELQVNCIQREEKLAQTYNAKLFEDARKTLDQNEDQLNRLQNRLSTATFLSTDTELTQE